MTVRKPTCVLLVLAVCLPVGEIRAQRPPPDCMGSDQGVVETSHLRVKLAPRASQWGPDFELKGDRSVQWVGSNLWAAGIVHRQLRVSASSWGWGQFWPGPPGAQCGSHDRVYDLGPHDYRLAGNEFFTEDYRDWPVHLGAPVHDGNGIPTDYSPNEGDAPVMFGDSMAWWIMNDEASPRVHSEGQAVGLTARATAFAFDAPGTLGTTLFLRYQLVYNGRQTLQDAFLGLFTDIELDNFIVETGGSDSTLGMAFAYSTISEPQSDGNTAPALGSVLLRAQGPDGTNQPVYAIMTYWGDNSVTGAPRTPKGYYNGLRGRWPDGQPVFVRGDGYPYNVSFEGVPTTRFALHGEPGSFWSSLNAYPSGRPFSNFRDLPSTVSVGPFHLDQGDSVDLLFALVWSRGADNLDSVRKLKDDVRMLKNQLDFILTPTSAPATDQVPGRLALSQPYPNPASRNATLDFELPSGSDVRIGLIDVLGREWRLVANGFRPAGSHRVSMDLEGLPPGLYLVRFDLVGRRFSRQLVVQ